MLSAEIRNVKTLILVNVRNITFRVPHTCTLAISNGPVCPHRVHRNVQNLMKGVASSVYTVLCRWAFG
jgi:hypothetical protein